MGFRFINGEPFKDFYGQDMDGGGGEEQETILPSGISHSPIFTIR